MKEVGDVTILVNNAGIMPQHEILNHTEKEIRMIYEINTIAHCWMFQAFLPKMIEKNRGHIVALSSIAGMTGLNNLVPYCGSKFAVRGTQEALLEELRQHSNGQSKVINELEICAASFFPRIFEKLLQVQVKASFYKLNSVEVEA